jgi:hypothetical protein
MDIQTMIQTNSPELRKVDEGELAMRVLEMLTPGGSEFYNDPVRCYEHIKDRFERNHRMIVESKKGEHYPMSVVKEAFDYGRGYPEEKVVTDTDEFLAFHLPVILKHSTD